ncbi:hypothetical protein PHMEG_0009537 [Phytophthora megakarya]|uniref:Uncharacterized protein n=1 Tax=Phytophthora megakarya TaxID=4795 RepID=A0A225WG01_9STRA|nr:hypothetical protein PHMEG_0009537 [Phytophthora megakarya]
MATIKISKFRGGRPHAWLKWNSQFRSLARKKQWTDEQKAHNLVALIDEDLELEVEQAAIDAINTDLDNLLWTMKKPRDETVVTFSQRLRENVRMFAELLVNAEEIPEVQQCRYLKRGMPRAWQEKLAATEVVHDRFSELALYFSHIEKAAQQHAAYDKKPGQQNHGQNKGQQGNKSNAESLQKDAKKNGDRPDSKPKGDKWCSFHNMRSHNTIDCYTVKKKEEQKTVEMKPAPPAKRKTRYPRIHKASDSDSDASEEYKYVGLVTKKERPTSAPL